jgi:hypothetical protein
VTREVRRLLRISLAFIAVEVAFLGCCWLYGHR